VEEKKIMILQTKALNISMVVVAVPFVDCST